MSDFKLLAIRPLKGCDRKFLKNLSHDKVYNFCNDYSFIYYDSDESKEVERISYTPTIPGDLYDIRRPGKCDIPVNISAIVGKNGSGKSSLLELLFLTIYLISVTEDVLAVTQDSLRLELIALGEKLKEDKINQEEYERSKLKIELKLEEIAFINNSLKVEVFYELSGTIYCIRVRKDADTKSGHNGINIFVVGKDQHPLADSEKIDFARLFYTIAVNYSIYGLNNLQLGEWIADLFHKNDGYKSPIVINPFREEGNININLEHDLAQTRLLANLVNDKMEIKSVLSGKPVSEIHFSLDPNKVKTVAIFNLEETISRFSKRIGKSEDEIFATIYLTLLGVELGNIEDKTREVPYFKEIIKYTIRKVIKIASTYDEYNIYITTDDIRPSGKEGAPFPSLTEFSEYLLTLKNDRSHITLKLRQILNTVRFNTLRNNTAKGIVWKSNQFELPIKEFTQRILKIKGTNPELEIEEIIPVAFFNPQIYVTDDTNHIGSLSSVFTSLSSGELQFIHTIQSILYHIINLDSVFESNSKGKYKFHYVNIVLDEIELYFHPDFQRIFVAELLRGISLLRIKNIKSINIIFSTHSPFILSDIPNQNILRLENGLPVNPLQSEKTLGANIHDLLANDFFLKESYMGEWVKGKIISAITFLEAIIENRQVEGFNPDAWTMDSVKAFANIMGEPLIRNSLRDMINMAFPDYSDLN